MKLWLGKYKHLSLHNAVEKLIGEKAADWLWDNCTPYEKLHHWLMENYSKTKIEVVKLDPWDTWNLDSTLAQIIHPCLIQLLATNHGVFAVDNEDCPTEMRSEVEENEISWRYSQERMRYVMEEMIWAFGKIKDGTVGDDYAEDFLSKDPVKTAAAWEAMKAEEARVDNATRLFGKYFRALWD